MRLQGAEIKEGGGFQVLQVEGNGGCGKRVRRREQVGGRGWGGVVDD